MARCEIAKLEVKAEPTLRDARGACGDCYITYFFYFEHKLFNPKQNQVCAYLLRCSLLYLCLCMWRASHK